MDSAVECELARIIISETTPNQIIVLREKAGARNFPIVIGLIEAMAIDREIKEERLPRPLTHDLLSNVIRGMGGKLERIVVNDLRDGTFFARLKIRSGSELHDIDARPSDAIALAVRCAAPLFVEEKVLRAVSLDAEAGKAGEIEGLDELEELDGLDGLELPEDDEGEKGPEDPKGPTPTP